MTPAELIAEWITALATGVVAIAAWIQLPLISKQVAALAAQIAASRAAEANAERRMREWETLKARPRYDFDPVIDGTTQRIWEASNNGKDYTLPGVNSRDIVCLLNYLDGLAVGIEQKLYMEEIVRDHLGPIFAHAVTRFLDPGIIPIAGLEKVRDLHLRWVGHPSYSSKGL